jgi:hypothetical protein
MKKRVNPNQLDLFRDNFPELIQALDARNWDESKQLILEVNNKDKRFNAIWIHFASHAPAYMVEEIMEKRSYGLGATELENRLNMGDGDGFIRLAPKVLTEEDKLFYFYNLARAAINHDQVKALEYLENHGLAVRQKQDALMMFAAEQGARRCLDNLVANGCSLTTNKGQVLEKAALGNQVEMFEHLIDKKVSLNETSMNVLFYRVATDNNPEMTAHLLDKYDISYSNVIQSLFSIYRDSEKGHHFNDDVVRQILPYLKDNEGNPMSADLILGPGIDGLQYLIAEDDLDIYSGYPWIMEAFEVDSYETMHRFIAQELVDKHPEHIGKFKPFFTNRHSEESGYILGLLNSAEKAYVEQQNHQGTSLKM